MIALWLPPSPDAVNLSASSIPFKGQNQQIHFFKNVALVGGALLVLYYGVGPLSVTG